MNLKEIRDRLLKEQKKENGYVEGVLDFYNEVKYEQEAEEEIKRHIKNPLG